MNSLMFFPRGGSAQVVRSLSAELATQGCEVQILCGSAGTGHGDADEFFAGLDITAVDFDAGDAPMHPSYEDRPGAPDVCFATVDDETYEAHVEAWSRAFSDAAATEADVLCLHHLTPLNEAARRVAPAVPVVAHLHGTELAMLERIAAGPPASWTHAVAWQRRMRRWAQECASLIVPTRAARDRAVRLLGVAEADCVIVANGFDPRTFRPDTVDRETWWREHLVLHPQGWRPGEDPGSVSYTDDEIAGLPDAVILLYAGRYTAVKRLGLLIEAFAAAKQRTRRQVALVILGGHPGEWESEHPVDAVARTGVSDVFLAGWHDHTALAGFLNAADVQVLASVDEQFGLVLVEGMACGLPPIAVDRCGPVEIVDAGQTGWLVEPDDERSLADAIVTAVDDWEERARRGLAAHRAAVTRWAWPALATEVVAVLEAAMRTRPSSTESAARSTEATT